MRLHAFQDTNGESVVSRRTKSRDTERTFGNLDENLDIEVGVEIELSWYVGGYSRGYDVRVKFNKIELLSMLEAINEAERMNSEQILNKLHDLRYKRITKLRDKIKHEEKLARRRERDRKKRENSKK